MNTNTDTSRVEVAEFEEWVRAHADDFELVVDREEEEIGCGISPEIMDCLRDDMKDFTVARMLSWMLRHPDRGVKRLRVHLHVDVA